MTHDTGQHLDAAIRIDNKRSAGIIRRGSELLFMRRQVKGREFVVCVGGHLQEGETPEQAVIREVQEEASGNVKNISAAFTFIDYQKANTDYYFLCDWEKGEPQLGGEEETKNSEQNQYELIWVPISQVSELNLLPKAAKEWIVETLTP